MKRLILAFLLCASSLAHAEAWYFGAGVGSSKLSYDTQTAIDSAIKQNNYGVPLAILSQAGSDLTFDNSFRSLTSSLILGYRLSSRWSFESQLGDLGSFGINGNFNLNKSGTIIPSSGYPIAWTASGEAVGSATLSNVRVISVSTLFTLSDYRNIEPYVRLGIGYLEGTLKTWYKYNYSYTTTINGQVTTTSDVYEKAETSSYGVPVGVGGVGVRFNIDSRTELRVEYQRLGYLYKDPNIDTYTLQLVRTFQEI